MVTKSFYFPHDRNVRNNAKVMNFIKHEGMAGYGAYWVIMEYLHAQDGYTALLDSVSYIVRLCSSTICKLKRIVMEYDLFVITFHSEELVQTYTKNTTSIPVSGAIGEAYPSLPMRLRVRMTM